MTPIARPVSSSEDEIFAANRARGKIVLSVMDDSGCTRRERVHEAGSLRVRFPNVGTRECEAMILNSAGGIAGGDSFDFAITLGRNAQLCVTGVAAEKVYRSQETPAKIAVHLTVAEGAALRWLPQETILFDHARLQRSFEIELAENASLLMAEAVVFGRAAMGETMQHGRLIDRWRLRRGGELVFAETLKLDGAIAAKMTKSAIANGAGAIASILVTPADDDALSAMRACVFEGEAGISAWNGIALARFCAPDGAILRRDVAKALTLLSKHAAPRLWLN